MLQYLRIKKFEHWLKIENWKLKIYLGSDHRGFELKEKLKQKLTEWGHDYEDVGPFEYNKDDDYPKFGEAVAKKVVGQPGSRGIVICGSGVGIGVTANKTDGIRAGTVSSPDQAEAAVHDEDMNVLSLSADFLTEEEALEIARSFIIAKYGEAERYERRLNEIKEVEAAN